LRDGQLEQLTDDHSLVEEARGRVADPSQINSNIITRAVGADQQLVLELESALLEEGDRFLLCSDGLNRDLDDAGIARLMAVGVPASASAGLVAQAVRAGGGDNITALIADYGCSAGTDP
jgi:type VI secretion system protein ImpM